MNRVQIAIDRLNAQHDTAKLRELAARLSIDFQEHFVYQEAQAHAHAGGIITADEAAIIYRALGDIHNASNGGWATDDPATVIVATHLIGELAGVAH